MSLAVDQNVKVMNRSSEQAAPGLCRLLTAGMSLRGSAEIWGQSTLGASQSAMARVSVPQRLQDCL